MKHDPVVRQSFKIKTLCLFVVSLVVVGCANDDKEDEEYGPRVINVNSPYNEKTPYSIKGSDCTQLESIMIVDTPCKNKINQHYYSNKAPLEPSSLIPLPVGSIVPTGWVGRYLELQKSGLNGRLDEISDWLQKEDNAWLSFDGKGKRGWEELPYWLRGYADLGYILNDEKVINKAEFWLEAVIENQRKDGNFGPFQTVNEQGHQDYWANMVMLNALQSYYDVHNDKRVLTLMTRYFKYLSTISDEAFLSGYWQKVRGGDKLYSVFWLYNRTGDDWLLKFAEKVHRNTANWSMKNDLPDWHNVNIAQAFREPATYFLLSGQQSDIAASYNNQWLIREMFGQAPGGMFAGDEVVRDGFDDPHQAIEACGMVEQMYSDEMMLWITGDTSWADHTENVAFNSLPAALTDDMKSIRYLTSPNMVSSTAENHAPGIHNEGPFMQMNPLSNRCCQHNHGMGWPYFSKNSWMATPDNGLAAIFYVSGEVKAIVGEGQAVSISTATQYPFEEQANFTLSMAESETFPLYFRIPSWAKNSTLTINNVVQKVGLKAGAYVRVEREWQNQDLVNLKVPMSLSVQRWEKNHNSASINYGPLTFSLKIEEQYQKVDPTKTTVFDAKWRQDTDINNWPAWDIKATSAWNYGLVLTGESDNFEVIHNQWPTNDLPFSINGSPLSIKAKVRKIPEWRIDNNNLVGELQDSPAYSNEPIEQVELIPMGAAKLRISAFPVVSSNKNANQWHVK